jgi:O-antigen/teichoic acid export membrane protein
MVNTVTSWAGMFANAAILIFLTKFLLHRLGAESYGMFRYVITILEFLVFLDLGLGATLNRFVSQLTISKDLPKLNSIISMTFSFFLGSGLVGGVIICGLGLVLPALVEGGTPEVYRSGFFLMLCMAGTLAVRFLGYAPRGVLFGLQRYDIVNALQCVWAILRAAAIAVFLQSTKSLELETIGLCYFGTAVFETASLWLFSKRMFPEMKIEFGNIDRAVVTEVLGFSVFVTLISFTTTLIANAPTFLVGKLYGSEAVAYLSLPMLVLGQLQRLSGGFAFTLIPVAGKYRAETNSQVLQELMVRGTKFCAAICFPVGILATVFGYPLFEWFRQGFGWTWALLAILMVPYLFRTTQRVSFSVLMGAGSVKWLSIAQIVSTFLIGLLSWLFGVYFNMRLYGIVLGTGIPVIVLSVIFQPAHACYQVGLHWLDYLNRSYTKVLLWSAPAALAGILLVRFIYPSGLIMIVSEGLVCLLIFAVCAWKYVLTDSERAQIIELTKWRKK